MRKMTSLAVLMVLSLPALAQQAPGDPTAMPAVAAPSSTATVGAASSEAPIRVGPDVGLDKVGDDGVSTRTVKAVPCSTSARETDGSTTCVGIPAPGDSRR